MITTITLPLAADIVAKVREIADARPGERAESVYYHRDSVDSPVVPVCLIGWALADLGVDLTQLDGEIDEILTFEAGQPDSPAVDWPGWAQHAQDGSSTWAEAVADADRRLKL